MIEHDVCVPLVLSYAPHNDNKILRSYKVLDPSWHLMLNHINIQRLFKSFRNVFEALCTRSVNLRELTNFRVFLAGILWNTSRNWNLVEMFFSMRLPTEWQNNCISDCFRVPRIQEYGAFSTNLRKAKGSPHGRGKEWSIPRFCASVALASGKIFV